MTAFIQDVLPHLVLGDICGPTSPGPDSPIVLASPTDFISVEWDAYLQPTGCGLGIAIKVNDQLKATFSVPVSTPDATRCEALGPPLIGLLVSRLPFKYFRLFGDSLYICKLLDQSVFTDDIQLYNCVELFKDCMFNKFYNIRWISREFN